MAQSQDPESDFTSADLFRRVRDIIRRGVVAEVQLSPPRCRVSFGGDHKTGWLQWYTLATSERVDWSAPEVGDPVTVLSEGGNLRGGVVLTGLLVDDRGSPSSNPHEHVTAYRDGARQTYDTDTHTLTWQGVPDGVVRIIAESKVEIVGNDEVTLTSENVVNINGGKVINARAQTINANASESVNVTATNSINLTTGTLNATAPGGITLNGPVRITRTLITVGNASFLSDLGVTGQEGGTGNLRTAGNVIAGGEVQDRRGTMSKIRTTYNGHTHICPDGATGGPSQSMV